MSKESPDKTYAEWRQWTEGEFEPGSSPWDRLIKSGIGRSRLGIFKLDLQKWWLGNITESWNGLKLFSFHPLPQSGTPSTRPGCYKLHQYFQGYVVEMYKIITWMGVNENLFASPFLLTQQWKYQVLAMTWQGVATQKQLFFHTTHCWGLKPFTPRHWKISINLESQNLLHWKVPTGIIDSSSWPCTDGQQSHPVPI